MSDFIGRLASAEYRVGTSGSWTAIPKVEAMYWSFVRAVTFSPGSFKLGSHTGTNDTAILTDSSQGFGVTGKQVGKLIQNLTDNSSGIVTASTFNTITATLAGGTDNDWDTNDLYRLVNSDNEASVGDLMITGELYLRDESIVETLIDISEFGDNAITAPASFPQLRGTFLREGTGPNVTKAFHPVAFGIGSGAEFMTVREAQLETPPLFVMPWAVMMDPRDLIAAHITNT